MPRWVRFKHYANSDNQMLARVTVFPEGINKESVKGEHDGFQEDRKLLVPNGERYEFR